MPHSQYFRRSRSTYAGTGGTLKSEPGSSPPTLRQPRLQILPHHLVRRRPLWPPALLLRGAEHPATTDGDRPRHARSTLGYRYFGLDCICFHTARDQHSDCLFRRPACALDVFDGERPVAPHKRQLDRSAHAGRTAANQPHYACDVHDAPFTESGCRSLMSLRNKASRRSWRFASCSGGYS